MYVTRYRKDVRLPVGFQRAMAAEAESSREARAKVGQNIMIKFNTLFHSRILFHTPGDRCRR